MVHPLNRTALQCIHHFFVCGAYLFPGETSLAPCIRILYKSAVAAIRSTMGRNRLESLRLEEAPIPLFAAGGRPNDWRVLGSVAYPIVAGDAELSDIYTVADHLRQP